MAQSARWPWLRWAIPSGIDERVHHCMARWPDVKIHLYGKGFRPGRKVGHVTALGEDLDEVREPASRRRPTTWSNGRPVMASSQVGDTVTRSASLA